MIQIIDYGTEDTRKFIVKEPLNDYARDPMKNLEFELKIRGYSKETIISYVFYNKKFLKFIKKSPKNVNQHDIKRFIESMIDKGFCRNTINLAINSLLFYYREIMRRRFHIKRLKKEERLYPVLSKEEVKTLICSVKNLKHRILFKLLYSAGLRVSEAIRLKTADIDFSSCIAYVRAGKGNKDRMFQIGRSLSADIILYINTREHYSKYIFDTKYGHMSRRTAEELCRKYAHINKITKVVTPHTFRRTFGTHHIENKTSINDLMKMMGHKNIDTTIGYVKNAGIKGGDLLDQLLNSRESPVI